MSDPDWYFITEFEEFIDHSRGLIFDLFLGSSNKDRANDAGVMVSNSSSNDDIGKILSCFEEDEPEQLALYLSHSEAVVIAKRFTKLKMDKRSKEEKYVISDELFLEMLECFNSRLISNLLNSLVNAGLVESAFDSTLNDFVFWPTTDFGKRNAKRKRKSKEKPETD